MKGNPYRTPTLAPPKKPRYRWEIIPPLSPPINSRKAVLVFVQGAAQGFCVVLASLLASAPTRSWVLVLLLGLVLALVGQFAAFWFLNHKRFEVKEEP